MQHLKLQHTAVRLWKRNYFKFYHFIYNESITRSQKLFPLLSQEATGVHYPQNDGVNKKEVMGFGKWYPIKKRGEENPQDNSEGRFQDERFYSRPREETRSEGIKKDFLSMKWMVYIWIISSENILRIKNIQIFCVQRQYVQPLDLYLM